MVEDGAGIPHLESEIRRLRDDLPSTKPATISLKTGDLFMARYRIMEELAAGCRGAVYQAENVQTNASVLIVLMLTEAIAREDVKPVSSNMMPPEPAKPLLSTGRRRGPRFLHIRAGRNRVKRRPTTENCYPADAMAR